MRWFNKRDTDRATGSAIRSLTEIELIQVSGGKPAPKTPKSRQDFLVVTMSPVLVSAS